MTYKEVIKELESLKNDRGIGYYKKSFGEDGNYLGLGLTQLRKLAKKIKTDVKIAEQLLDAEYFEAKMLSFMVDDPKQYNKKRIEDLIKKLLSKYSESPLSYFTMVFTEFISAKSPDAKDIVIKYSKSKNEVFRFIAFSTLNNLAKNKKVEDDFINQFLEIIEQNIQSEANNVKDSMNNSMLVWGQRSKTLNSKILKIYKNIGKVVVDYGETSCQTPDVPKILSSERIQKKIS